MSAADIIKPYLLEADRRKPHLRIDNRRDSCGELLSDTLEIAATAGHDFRFIGKSGRKGEAGFRPAWFTEVWVPLHREDGQAESVLIDQLGMDAAWYMPTNEQVKVIANSTANDDPRPEIHGPANLTPYMIERQYYRWHNPPMPRRGGTTAPPPLPPPVTQPGGRKPYPGDPVWDAVGEALFADYALAKQAPNGQMGRWFGRTIWDATEGDDQGKVWTIPDSIAKHRGEWRAELPRPTNGWPPS